MTRKFLISSLLIFAFMFSGCSGWHIPFFGSKEAKEETPLVQDSTAAEEPQYSGPQPASNPQPVYGGAPASGNYAPAAGGNYAPPAGAAYGQAPGAAGAFTPGQPYSPNANYALNASPGYGAPGQAPGAAPAPYGTPQPFTPGYPATGAATPAPYGAAPQPYGAQPAAGAYGAYPAAQPGPAAAPQAGIYGQNLEQGDLGGQGAFMGAAPDGNLSFGGIKRKTLFIISYPQRGLSTIPYDSFSRQIYQRLAASPALNLVPREAVDQVAQQFFSQTLDASSRLSRLGQELGAQAIILEKVQFAGNFGGNGYGYAPPKQVFQLQLIDTATGYPVKSYTVDPATPAVNQVVNNLINYIRMIDWSARVIKVEKNRVLINAGRLSGLQIGQNLRIYAKGSNIKDPTTKLSLGNAQGALKGTVKVVDFFGLDGAICEPVAAGKFSQGDMVKAVE